MSKADNKIKEKNGQHDRYTKMVMNRCIKQEQIK